MDKFRVGVIGAQTKTGAALIRLLAAHPYVHISALAAEGYEGRMISLVHPELTNICDIICCDKGAAIDSSDIIFAAVSREESEQLSAECIQEKCVYIDLSGNYCPATEAAYTEWFGRELDYPGLHEVSVYGLPELLRENIIGKVLIGVPSAVATAAALALSPALMVSALYTDSITITAVQPTSCPVRVTDSPEIEQILTRMAGESVNVCLTQHTLPNTRGLLVTCSAKLKPEFSEAHLQAAIEQVYGRETFVRIMKKRLPSPTCVIGSNFTDVSVRYDQATNTAVFTAALDDTVKGSAGIAVQNMNVLLSISETVALDLFPVTSID